MPRMRQTKRPPKMATKIREKTRSAGKPRIGAEVRRIYSVRLEPATRDMLISYGNGNLSAGVTRAAALVKLCGAQSKTAEI